MKTKVNESSVEIRDGEVVTIFSDEIEQTGYMSIEECSRLCHESLRLTNILIEQNESTSKVKSVPQDRRVLSECEIEVS
jgi:hypothetical protein